MGYVPSFPELTDLATPENIKFLLQELMGQWSKRKKKRTEAQLAERLARIAQLHSDQIVGPFLLRLYGLGSGDPSEPVLRIRGNSYPIYTKPEWQVRRSVDDVLLRPLVSEPYAHAQDAAFQEMLEKYRAVLADSNRIAFDADTFRLLEVCEGEDEYKLRCSRGRYFGFLGTCGILSDELMDQLIENDISIEDAHHDFIQGTGRATRFKKVVEGLSARRLFAPNRSGLLDLRRRDCKIGLNVMTVIDTHSGPLCMLHRRGKATAEYPDLHHVIPAGTFQPDGRGRLSAQQLNNAFSLRHKVLSELWEECFEAKDFTSQEHVNYGRIDLASLCVAGDKDKKPIAEIMTMLANDEALLFVTGFGIDLLVASPELSLLLVIKNRDFAKRYEPHWKLNWEFPGFDGHQPVRPHCFYDLSDVDGIYAMIRPGHAVPAGAMAVAQGYRTLSQLASEDLVDFKVPAWTT